MHHKIIHICLLTVSALTFGTVHGQTIRLNSWKYLTDISADLSQLFNYNLYEGQRWGLGLQITTPLGYNPQRARDKQNALLLTGYGAYGLLDHGIKFGGSMALLMPNSRKRSMGIAFSHDINRTGSRQLGSYNMLATYNNSNYVSSRYVGVNRLSIGFNQYVVDDFDISAHLRFSREDYRFNESGYVVPSKYYGMPHMPYQHYMEEHLLVKYRKNLTMLFQGGYVKSDASMDSRLFARLLAQYSEVKTMKNKRADHLYIFSQLGYATPNTPFSRLYDLSGTAGYNYFFRNSFMTVSPTAFVAHQFAFLCLHYLWGRPLWKTTFSNPQPFAQVCAMWGSLSRRNNGSQLIYSLRREAPLLPSTTQQIANDNIIALNAPDYGVLEPSIGIERIIRWGYLDLGVACAYQLTPATAPYHLDGADNFAWMIMANLILEYNN